MLKPGWLASETEAGVALSHAGPTGTGSPPTDRLVICRVMLDMVVTAPVFRSTVPVVGPSWMKATVAVVPADARAGVVATTTAVTSPARAVTVAPRTARLRRSRFMRSPWSLGRGG